MVTLCISQVPLSGPYGACRSIVPRRTPSFKPLSRSRIERSLASFLEVDLNPLRLLNSLHLCAAQQMLLVTGNGPATSTFDRLHKSYGGGSPEFLSLVISLAVETLILYPAIGAKWKEVKT
jgi:hypothetical protein